MSSSYNNQEAGEFRPKRRLELEPHWMAGSISESMRFSQNMQSPYYKLEELDSGFDSQVNQVVIDFLQAPDTTPLPGNNKQA